MVEITGNIIFDTDDAPFADAVAYVVLEDTGRAGAPSGVIARQTINGVSNRGRVPFSLRGPMPGERTRANIRVHVSRNHSQDIEVGDYITTQSYPVLTQGNPNQLDVHVRRVG